jgi:transcriptional regulator with XRE-family HTH domain
MVPIHWIDDFTSTRRGRAIPMAMLAQDTFGGRLAALRKARGMTQEDLGRAGDTSQRMVAHYENTPGAQPPADVVVSLARALGVTADELPGLSPLAEEVSSATYRLRKRLRKVEELPPDDQKTVVKIVEALVEKRAVENAG